VGIDGNGFGEQLFGAVILRIENQGAPAAEQSAAAVEIRPGIE
jgi:hypothetical protein